MAVQPVDVDAEFERIVGEMLAIRKRKKADYAKAYAGGAMGNLEMAGWQGVVVRLGDKLSRLNGFALQSLIEGVATAANEPVEDAFLDGAVYNILGLICYRAGVSWRKDKSSPLPTDDVCPECKEPFSKHSPEAVGLVRKWLGLKAAGD